MSTSILLGLMLNVPVGNAAGAAAQFRQNAASTVERKLFGPELIGKVTKAGKVGNIDAKAGEIVLREVVPNNRGGRSALGPATIQDATVLHGQHIRTIDPSNTSLNYRIVVAVQENQSREVRAYAKGHLFSSVTGNLVSTHHRLDLLRASNFDYDSAGDGCGPYPTGQPCIYEKNPGDVLPPSATVIDYYALGQYRHKCGQEGWNCDNTWATFTNGLFWRDPTREEFGGWLNAFTTCSYYWNVLHGQAHLHCLDT